MNHWETGPATEHLDLSISGHTPLLQRGPGLEALVCLSILSPPPLHLPGSPGLWLAAGNRFAAHLSFYHPTLSSLWHFFPFFVQFLLLF